MYVEGSCDWPFMKLYMRLQIREGAKGGSECFELSLGKSEVVISEVSVSRSRSIQVKQVGK